MHKSEKEMPQNRKIQWHPGFYAAAEIELRENREELEFHREYNLSKKPLQIDLLIIEKLKDVQIQNEIGNLFRRYNIIEYKSPEDNLNIDDFFKTLGYAYLYKGMGEWVNKIPLEELTVSFFHESRPVKTVKELEKKGCVIKEYAEGIHYVEGLMIPAQIIVTRELKTKEHSSLKVLTPRLEHSDLLEFMECANSFTEPGDKRNADAILQVSISANRRMYDQIRRSDDSMCEALRELFKDELDEKIAAARKEAVREGLQEGESRLNELYSRLEQDGRREEIFLAMKNPELLKKFYKEYGMG